MIPVFFFFEKPATLELFIIVQIPAYCHESEGQISDNMHIQCRFSILIMISVHLKGIVSHRNTHYQSYMYILTYLYNIRRDFSSPLAMEMNWGDHFFPGHPYRRMVEIIQKYIVSTVIVDNIITNVNNFDLVISCPCIPYPTIYKKMVSMCI